MGFCGFPWGVRQGRQGNWTVWSPSSIKPDAQDFFFFFFAGFCFFLDSHRTAHDGMDCLPKLEYLLILNYTRVGRMRYGK